MSATPTPREERHATVPEPSGMYEWTARSGVHVVSEVPRREPFYDSFRGTHLVWSYLFTGRKLAVGYAGIANGWARGLLRSRKETST